jgi:N-acetylmuramoyl-L-alanine amidase
MLKFSLKNTVFSVMAAAGLLTSGTANATEYEINYVSDPVIQELMIDESFDEESISYSDEDLFCLAKNIYHEARGEPERGKRAVAQVTLNRVEDPRFRNSICGVVHEPYQFSWANNKSKRWSVPTGTAWAEAQILAEEILSDGHALPNMDRALFFHSTKVRPGWRNMRRLATIGNHVFYSKG